MFCVFILALGFIALSWLFIAKTGEIRLPPASDKTITFGEKGLILFSSGGSNESIVLLDGPQEYPRVVVFPDAQAEYQRTRDESAADALRAAPLVKPLFFRNDESAFMAKIMDKFHIITLKFEELAANGHRDFMLYAASLILLLVSVRFIMNISSWHFANLLFGGLFFSGILYLEAFVDSIQAQNLISTAIKGIIPKNYISPAVFCLAALLFISIAVFFHALSKRTQEKGMRRA